jgi:hypothetical protein
MLSALLLPACALAEESASDASLDSIAVELMNPIGRFSAIDNRFGLKSYQGSLPDSSDRTNSSYIITPVIPFELSNGRRLALRFSLPVSFSTPTYVDDGKDHAEWLVRQRADTLADDGQFIEGHGHMDDISYGLAYGDTEDNGLFWMAGLAGVLPTSQDGSIERDQYLLGPEFAIGKSYGWGILGVWGKHLVDVADVSRNEDQHPVDWNTNETTLRLIFAYGLGNGWQVVSNPDIVYDWEGASGNKILFPVGGGVAKAFRIGSVPVKANLEAYYYVESPDAFGPEWQINISITPVLSFWSLD